MRVVLEALYSERNRNGFSIKGVSHHVKLLTPAYFIGDHDAAREILCVKGSCGLVPCHRCSNVIAQKSVALPDNCCGLAEADLSRCYLRTDGEFFRQCDDIAAEGVKSRRLLKEKARGIRWLQGGLPFSIGSRDLLPPSNVFGDFLHDYFCNGCASWECGFLVSYMKECGIAQESLLQVALESQWQRSGMTIAMSATLLKSLLGSKTLDDNGYHDEGNKCWALVFLLHYYVYQILLKNGRESAETKSFLELAKICREIRNLQAKIPLKNEDVQATLTLARLQSSHQTAFGAAYTNAAYKPKHHHRLHLPLAFMMLKCVPQCNAQEKKHKILKSGQNLINRLEHLLHDSSQLQWSILPRQLLSSLPKSSFIDNCLTGCVKKTSNYLKAKFQDMTLASSRKARVNGHPIHVGDIVLRNDAAWRVEDLVQGEDCPLQLKAEILYKETSLPYGSSWVPSNKYMWYEPGKSEHLTVAVWWRKTTKGCLCLHYTFRSTSKKLRLQKSIHNYGGSDS